MAKMLIADDHRQISEVLSLYAKREGYEVFLANNGIEALDIFKNNELDIALLDLMMPGIDGFELCKMIREKSNLPIIMITARGEDYDRIMGLDLGADDYVVKPFSPAEVMARVRAVLRRIDKKSGDKKRMKIHNLFMDLDSYRVFIDQEELSLTRKEVEILWTLASSPDRVYSRDNLLDLLWGYDYEGDKRTVDSHIKRLRHKLGEQKNWEIATVWGLGYRFEVKDVKDI